MSRVFLLPLSLAVAAFACTKGGAATRTEGGALTTVAAASAVPSARDSITDAADKGRIMGKESAPLWFIVVSDFQCPFCKAWHDSSFKMIKRDYVETGKIRMAFINVPLHANSMAAAVTAMCAAAQGKFWETHDRVFDSQDAWKSLHDPRPFLDSLAVASGANAAKLKTCEAGKGVPALIAADQSRFQTPDFHGTPTFYIGGATMVGALPPAEFRHVIDSVVAAGAKH